MNKTCESPPSEMVYGDLGQTSPNSSDPHSNTNVATKSHTNRQLTGAAVAGGIAGLVIGGPIIGVVAAGGCALAVTRNGQTGQVARAGGEAAARVGDQIKKIRPKRVVAKGRQWATNRMTPKDSTNQSYASKPIY
jgi:methylthioribose-1-phosphate isomerase